MRTRNRSIVVSKEQLIEREARVKERKERKHCVSPPLLFLCTVFLVFVGVTPHWGLLWRTSVIKRKKILLFSCLYDNQLLKGTVYEMT